MSFCGARLLVAVACAAIPATSWAQQPNAILAHSTEALLAAQRSALVQIAPEPRVDGAGVTRVTACVSVNRGGQEFAADTGTLAVLSIPGRHAVIPRDCPRTYAMALYSTDHPPRGWIDPYYISVTRVSASDTTTLVISIDVTQDVRTKSYRCDTRRSAAAWKAECRLVGSRAGE
jgi:hypothetical protein